MLAFRIGVVSGLFTLLTWPSLALAAPPEEEPAPAEAVPEPAPSESEPVSEPASDERRAGDELGKPVVDIGPKHSIVYTSLLAPRVNPLGLEERLWLGYQYRLYTKSSSLWKGSNFGLFLRPILSPAIGLIGPTVQFQPLAILRLRATWSFVGWMGTFDYMQSYQSPYDDFSDTRLDEQTLKEENYATIGHQTELELLFQVKVKSIILRNTLTADYNRMKLRGDDDVYYDIRIDALVPNNGWVLFNDTDLMWSKEFKGPRKNMLLAGARATVIRPFYPDAVYEPGDPSGDPMGPIFRLGPNLGYVFYDRPDVRPRFNRPTLLLIPQWNILHRWRSGRDVSVGYPTITLAFVFNGELWRSKDK